MSKKMLINATHPEENRVAIVEDGILTELDIEIAGKEQTKGNIYKAAVVRVEPGLQAAFIDYGGERFGFLQMGEVHPSYFRTDANGEKPRYPRINDVLRRGQELLVQIVKEERGTKGAALTTFLSLPGRYMVLMPDSDTKGVSRKIEDEGQRKKLKEAMASLDLPSSMGYIVRTAGIGQKKEELRRDFDYLVRVFEKIQETSLQMKAPALIYKESNLVIRSLRDYFSADMDEVLVDDPRVCQEAKDFFQAVMPEYARLVKLHQEKRPIFSRYQIEEQIETITKNKVPLPSGGSIVIDATEALVAIDVNSGKMAGEQGVEATAYKTNLEAAAEAARQLRLRDLGGLIVLDFIDMRERKHIREVEKCLKDALKYDKARVTVGRISQFGLLEMSRQRIKAALAEGSYLACPHCHGSGRVKSAEAQAIAFLRKVHGAVAKGQVGRIEGEVPLDVATYLLNSKREELLEMERHHQVAIFIKGRPDFIAGQADLSTHKREKEEFSVPDFLPAVAAPPPVPTLEPQPAMPAPPPQPAEPPAEEAVAEDAARKKRKRKRRKKKPEEIPAAGETVETAGEIPAVEPSVAQAAPPPTGDEPATAAEITAAHGIAAEAAGEESGRKKRKRKRRKKKTEGIVAAEATEAPAGETPAPEAPAEAPETLEASSTEEGLAGEPREERRKKRRRKKKKAPATAAAATPEEGASPAVESTAEGAAIAAAPAPTEIAPPPAAPPEASAQEPEKGEEKASRRRPRSRRLPRGEAAAAADESPSGAAATEMPPPSPAEISIAAAVGQGGGKPARRPRPSRQRPEAEIAAAATAPEALANQESPAAVGTEESAARPKRRPPRKKAPVREDEPSSATPD